jgi:selT/selW/selH-like putative selenoprotein
MASGLEAAIKQEFGLTAELEGGHGGVFDVRIDGQTVYSKHQTNRFPTNEEIFATIRARRKS